MAANPEASEDEVVRVLQERGYSPSSAEKLNVFVPSAFSWALLRRMGVRSFPSYFVAIDVRGAEVQLPIAGEHYFTAALELAYTTLENGWSEDLSRQAFETVASRSAEMGAANKTLTAGESLEGASLQPLKVFRLSAEAASGT